MIKLLVILFLFMPVTSILKSFVSDYDKWRESYCDH